MKTKSPLSYFGSDAQVAEEIAAYFQSCNHITIPFVGGASILPFLKDKRIVANDLNEFAINFYKVASGRFGDGPVKRLILECSSTLSHPSEIMRAAHLVTNHKHAGWQELAWAYWALCWVGRGGNGGTSKLTDQTKPSFRMTNSGGSNASRINTAAEELSQWAACMKNCEWTCMEFSHLIPKVRDNSTSGIYADPPWYTTGDAYLYTFTTFQHVLLAELLNDFNNARILIRYDDCGFIRNLYPGWNILEKGTRNQGNRKVPEIWLANHEYAP